MSLPRFFLPDQVLADQTDPVFVLRLAPDDVKHARVLRLAPGEHIAVIDATQDYFECEIVRTDDDGMWVRIASHQEAGATGPVVVLYQGLAKGDKMDEIIRHATELGVAGFVPLACARSVLKLDATKVGKRVARWRSIAKSAAMQSGQAAVPEVSEPRTVAQAAADLAQATCVIVCWEEAREGGIHDALEHALEVQRMPRADARVAVVVGPEGGLTEAEVNAFLGCNRFARTVTLGSSILRTETAGVVAPALVLYELGALQ